MDIFLPTHISTRTEKDESLYFCMSVLFTNHLSICSGRRSWTLVEHTYNSSLTAIKLIFMQENGNMWWRFPSPTSSYLIIFLYPQDVAYFSVHVYLWPYQNWTIFTYSTFDVHKFDFWFLHSWLLIFTYSPFDFYNMTFDFYIFDFLFLHIWLLHSYMDFILM